MPNVCLWIKIMQGNRISPGGAGTPLYRPYMYVPPQRVGFLRRFGLKMGIGFTHFGVESGMVIFKGLYERIIVSIPNKLERKRRMRIQNGFQGLFVPVLN